MLEFVAARPIVFLACVDRLRSGTPKRHCGQGRQDTLIRLKVPTVAVKKSDRIVFHKPIWIVIVDNNFGLFSPTEVR